MTRKLISVFLVYVSLAALSAVLAQAPGSSPRYRWINMRLREVGNVGRKFHLVKKPVLLKLDTATGKVWRYTPESLTVDVEGEKSEYGHFRPLSTEGLPNLTPPKPKKPAKKGQKVPVPVLPNDRFGFSRVSVQKTVPAADGETVGLVEQDEVFLTDKRTGTAWILKTIVETIKEKGKDDTKISRHKFVRLFNEGELVVVDEEGKKAKPLYKLSKSLVGWKEVFMNNRSGKELADRNKAQIDCVIILSKDDKFSPMVIMRKVLKDTRSVAVTPWQVELHSDRAVDYLCDQVPVDFDKADRYAIFINTSKRAARGFNSLQTHMIGGLPDYDNITKLIKTE